MKTKAASVGGSVLGRRPLSYGAGSAETAPAKFRAVSKNVAIEGTTSLDPASNASKGLRNCRSGVRRKVAKSSSDRKPPRQAQAETNNGFMANLRKTSGTKTSANGLQWLFSSGVHFNIVENGIVVNGAIVQSMFHRAASKINSTLLAKCFGA